ncbi:MAG: DUF2203 family protein [Acidobacteriota bacterium]
MIYPYRIFTLEQANQALPEIVDLTHCTRTRLQALRATYGLSPEEESAKLEEETRGALNEWVRTVLKSGAQPKGIFTVDFRSPDPNMLWCWTPDEDSITHRHFTWESFKDRVPLDDKGRDWLSCS